VGGAGAGRRTRTEQINWALILRLAAEFQGFTRDLNTLGVTAFAEWSATGNIQLEVAIEALLTRGLKLDVGNATPAAIGEAFDRFGIRWWPALEIRDQRTAERQRQLDRLNRARNAIGHARLGELITLRNEGFPLNLDTVTRWRSALNAVCFTMDGTLAEHLGVFFNQPNPW